MVRSQNVPRLGNRPDRTSSEIILPSSMSGFQVISVEHFSAEVRKNALRTDMISNRLFASGAGASVGVRCFIFLAVI